jgi:hypothetical protein
MKRTYQVTASRPPGIFRGKRQLDSVDIQFSVSVNVPKGKRLRAEVIREAIMYRAKHGRAPRGFTIKLIRWRNPNRLEGDPDEQYSDPESAQYQAGWRSYGGQSERIGTLARVLRGSHTEYDVRETTRGIRRRVRRHLRQPTRGPLVVKRTKRRKAGRKKRSKKIAGRRRRSPKR